MGFGEEKGKRKREIEKRKKPEISLVAATPCFKKGGTMSAQDNLKLWETHIRGEFMTKDTDLSLSTMVEDASVLTVPTGWGGKGKKELWVRYHNEFIPSIPPSWKHTTLKVTASDDYIVEEARINLVHTQQMDWFLPGMPATNKPIEFDIVLVVQFRDGKMAAERIYWDQAAVLRQVGKL